MHYVTVPFVIGLVSAWETGLEKAGAAVRNCSPTLKKRGTDSNQRTRSKNGPHIDVSAYPDWRHLMTVFFPSLLNLPSLGTLPLFAPSFLFFPSLTPFIFILFYHTFPRTSPNSSCQSGLQSWTQIHSPLKYRTHSLPIALLVD